MASVDYKDLSGPETTLCEDDNPYQPLINATNDDPVQLQSRYTVHRTSRNEQQRRTILDPNFEGWTLDPIICKLDGPDRDPNFQDDRFCITFWGRPPQHIRDIVDMIQQELRSIAPTLWFMPLDHLHITTLEVIHSTTESNMESIVSTLLKDGAAEKIANFTSTHRARLIKPMISFDTAAMALSFVPAAGEGLADGDATTDAYTYHHLRRDVYSEVRKAGVVPAQRYVVPSAHLTIARFITQEGFKDERGQIDHNRVRQLIDTIDSLNDRLRAKFWPTETGEIPKEGEWIVGQEKGLDFRKGRLWYGGGETILLGRGF